jgi:cytochrome c553
VNDPAGTNVVRAVLEGIEMGSLGGHNTMPPFAGAYSDEEIAAVCNYVIAHSAASGATSRRSTFAPLAIEAGYWKLANEANLVWFKHHDGE